MVFIHKVVGRPLEEPRKPAACHETIKRQQQAWDPDPYQVVDEAYGRFPEDGSATERIRPDFAMLTGAEEDVRTRRRKRQMRRAKRQ